MLSNAADAAPLYQLGAESGGTGKTDEAVTLLRGHQGHPGGQKPLFALPVVRGDDGAG